MMFYRMIIWCPSIPLCVYNRRLFSFHHYVTSFVFYQKTECKSIYYHFRRDHESSSFPKLARNKWICRETCDFLWSIYFISHQLNEMLFHFLDNFNSLLNDVPCVPTYQRTCVPAWFTCQRACVPTSQKRANFSFLRASVLINVPTYHTACQHFNWLAIF